MAKKKRKSKREGVIEKPINNLSEEDQRIVSKLAAYDSAIIDLNEEQLSDFADMIQIRLKNFLDSGERKDEVDRIKKAREDYEKGVVRTQFIPNGHDYRSHFSAAQTDGIRSRLVGLFSVDPIIKLEGRNKQGIVNQPTAEKFLDYHHDVNTKLPDKGETTCAYLGIEGHAVWYAPYQFEIDPQVKTYKELQKFIQEGTNKIKWINIFDQDEVLEAAGEDYAPIDPPEYKVEEITKAEIKKYYPELQVLSLEDYARPTGLLPHHKPMWEAVKQEFTLQELMDFEEQGKIYSGSVDKLKTFIKGLPKQDTDESDNDAKKPTKNLDVNAFGPNDLDAGISCWVLWGKFRSPKTKRLERFSVIYHLPSHIILQVKNRIYVTDEGPVFHLRMIRDPNRFQGIGSMELSSPGEKSMNDLVNYVLDETRIYSCQPFKYRIGGGYNPGTTPMDFWKGIGLKNMNDFQPMNWSDKRTVDLNIATYLRANTERRVGIGDLQLGRESDVTGKQPPTARGIMSILREGAVRFSLLNFSMIQEMLRFAEYEMILFQQFVGESLVIDAVGVDGKDLFPKGLSKRQILGKFRYIANVSAQNLVRELDIELNLMLYNLFQNNKLLASDLSAYYQMTNDVILSTGKKKSWLKPLSFYLQKLGKGELDQETLSPEEQEFVNTLRASGVSDIEIKKQLDILRGGLPQGVPSPSLPETETGIEEIVGRGGEGE